MHPLDRPVWSALTSLHAPLSVGDARALRYRADVNVFASPRDDGAEALAALADLVTPEAAAYMMQAPPIIAPPGLAVEPAPRGVQMVLDGPLTPTPEIEAWPLSDADAEEMLALATLTQPGPFRPRTHVMGRFIGVRRAGKLIAMAGERMRMPGFTEVSGVCTHPDARGEGLARKLSAKVARAIVARGDTPFLHAWKTNAAAISIYTQLGFKHRTDVHVAMLSKSQSV